MPFRFKRHWTPFGEVIHKRGPRGTNLLITRGGKRLLLNYRKLLKGIKVEAVGAKDRVTFAKGFNPKPIGEGAHGLIYLLSPKLEASFKARSIGAGKVRRPSIVLKVYRASVPKELEPDGFTQFLANRVIYDYLTKGQSRSFVVRPLTYYFVSDNVAVRNFINAPTLEELKESFVSGRRKPLSFALADKAIDSFSKKFAVKPAELVALQRELLATLRKGQKNNFNSNIPLVHDPTIKNFFVLGRNQERKLIVSVIDQGRVPVKGLGNSIRKGLIA